ncbi:NAD(P)/FAD-dependent oxidoreductase [Mycobacteroides abscessus]|uniref:NAD(P)/FAD-dependent oxidoreductase n=1 Tax=Mycobacteroides abscessus TaxID=36809 RepID=UPI0009A5799D|nr:FAD-dependent oxidoreductase [Mycobacteroides abscessus]SKF64749.1 NAD(P)H-nitrite reductase [Mycobacteroides abscessus subsp. bolletii]SKF64865.1 NAD(P)H-nitrite reductase [Mycobacteroides abscessus subsp. bolletii]SKF85838.1 NAD(P)H-nitrite reductase [Mycobacteroides abscessus subsp. bolletii]SKG60563.1 NAD(P)H-nitrite reductase [Mycobacteroides abscessus subsp. bolletii]SKG73264.1 NAD(P)H-nitrite reductase [Mycobacteroides abscessus subsp. bolletii]
MKHVAIIGASLAGLSAARALRAKGFDGRVTVVGDEAHRPYDRPPLSKEFLSSDMTETDLALEADDDDLQADWLLGAAAINLDTRGGAIELADGARIDADGVIIATGSRARRWPDCEAMAGVHVIRTIDDAIALRADLQAGARLVVIGAGFIGAEIASTARKLDLEVTVVEVGPTPLQVQLGSRLGAVVAARHAVNGTTLICGVGVAGLTGERGLRIGAGAGRVTGVDLVDGRHLPADTVVVGIGAVPNIEWLHGSGLRLGNGVLCGSNGQTDVPNVVAVGDCAAWLDPSTGSVHRVEHWMGALERPAIAVGALLSGGLDPCAPVKPPYFWSDQYGSHIQFAGIAGPDDEITIEDGSCEDHCFLATYRRGNRVVAVLAVDQPRLFARWRRQIGTVAAV